MMMHAPAPWDTRSPYLILTRVYQCERTISVTYITISGSTATEHWNIRNFAAVAVDLWQALGLFTRVLPVPAHKLAYTTHAGPITASAFNRLGQYASSPCNRAYCYAELVVSSIAVAETVVSILILPTHVGMARLSRPWWLVKYGHPFFLRMVCDMLNHN